MITLHTFGPAFGLPDPSPFVTKVEVLLKMAGLPYRTDATGLRGAPKGKLPYIDDDGERVADSTFIRWHLENKYRIDFEKGLSPEQRAIAWAFEKMMEDNLYWALVDARWFDEANFAKGPKKFLQKNPGAGAPAHGRLHPATAQTHAPRPRHGPAHGRRDRRARHAVDRRDCGFSWAQAVLHGRRAGRHRCNYVRLRCRRAVSSLRYAAAHRR